jgi:phospholipase C
VTLTVTNAYGGHRTVTLHHNATVTHTIDLDHSDRWYDVTVSCDKDRTFRRRFAGHVENGEPGLSDPAILTH